MAVIKQDSHGLFFKAGGFVCRPVIETRYKVGDKVIAHVFSQSIRIGVGKDENSKPGEYLENWMGTRMSTEFPCPEADLIAHTRVEMLSNHGRLFDYRRPSQEDVDIDSAFCKRMRGNNTDFQ